MMFVYYPAIPLFQIKTPRNEPFLYRRIAERDLGAVFLKIPEKPFA